MQPLTLDPGNVVVYNGNIVIIVEVGRLRLRVRDLASGELFEAKPGEIKARTTPAILRRADDRLAALTNATSEQWQRAKTRERFVLRILASSKPITKTIAALAAREQVSERTLKRWLARYREWPHTSALLDHGRGNRAGAQRLTTELETLVFGVIDDLYLARPKATIEAVYREVHARCRLRRLKTPSRNAVNRRIKALDPQVVARHQLGAQEANRLLGAKPGSFNVDQPLAVVQIDHTLVDVIVVDDVHRKPIGRPWITLAIDVATRCVMGFYLSLEPPSVASVSACITQACLPKDQWLTDNAIDASWPLWGLPLTLHADNAREFKSEALQRGCAEHGIQIVLRPIARPHYGGHIERLIGTLMGRVHLLPGTTASNPVARGRYRSEKEAKLTLVELEKWIAIEICERYHLNIHRALRAAPLHAWQDWFADRGRAPAIPGDPARFLLSFLPIEYRRLQRDGLHFTSIRYWDNVLPAIARKGDVLLVRYDPRDLSRLYVLGKDRRYWPIPYADLRRPRITLAEAKSALASERAKGQCRIDEQRLFEAAIKQRAIVAKAAQKNKVARRAQQRRSEATRQKATATQAATVEDTIDYSKPAVPYDLEIWEKP